MATTLELAKEALKKAEKKAGGSEGTAEEAAKAFRLFVEAGIEPVGPATGDSDKADKESMLKAKDLALKAFEKSTSKDDTALVDFASKHAESGQKEREAAERQTKPEKATEKYTSAASEYLLAGLAWVALAEHTKVGSKSDKGDTYVRAAEYFGKAAHALRVAGELEGTSDHKKREKRAEYRAAQQLSELAELQYKNAADAYDKANYAGSGFDSREARANEKAQKDNAEDSKKQADDVKTK